MNDSVISSVIKASVIVMDSIIKLEQEREEEKAAKMKAAQERADAMAAKRKSPLRRSDGC